MSEELVLPISGDKEEIYKQILPQIESIISTEKDIISNLANVTALLKEAFNFFWVGFYIVKDNELVLAPFQGPLACTRIKRGKGVCGSSFERKTTIIVDDVELFDGHIACSSHSRSEIVVPIIIDNEVWAVLDIDSKEVADFDDIDKNYLELISKTITTMVIRCR